MGKETIKFKTEVNQLLDLMINSLYSNKEIFLRELISNSSDAIDKVKYEGLKDKSLLEDNESYKIKIAFDKDSNTITLTDNGIGMSKDDAVNNLGTIAKSGTKEFMAKIREAKKEGSEAELIGQFGVGFYSAFMVSDKIVVETRKGGEKEGVKWESTGKSDYAIEMIEKADRGTKITLFLKKDAEEFASEWRIKEIVRKYSDYISYPITMDVEREEKQKDAEGKIIEDSDPIITIEEETLNSMKAIWKKDKKDVTDDEYNEFYKHISHDYTDPIEKLHLHAEGSLEYNALLYLPSKAPFDLFMRESKTGISLYVKNVFIMDDCKKLLPEHFRFIKGVVDSSDLPLNVSREILQEDKTLTKIQKNLVKKVISTLKSMKEKRYEEYLKFYNEFGKVVKEGIYSDFENKDKLLDLLLFESTNTEAGKFTSLKDYLENMKEDQKEIYFITGESRSAVANSPHLEKFKEKGYEVLFFTDPIDEFISGNLGEFKEKKFKAVGKGEVDLSTEEEKKENENKKKELSSLTDLIKSHLEEDIKEVRISNRLTSSPVVLVTEEGEMTAQMEQIMRQMNQEIPKTKRIMEINPNHPIVSKMKEIYDANAEDAVITDYAELLFGQALIAEGQQVKDPVKFNKLISDLMLK
ncbi:MAG: molecular chaperone HtpG [Candidatus Cloacimonadota bacterium]|nr:MAG: molecular chaperone HtpG [Candidatus Cloacimonadota bacterium]PIE79709.1 MAG: molecular chaperone HtpG [Candidatus Delongbacteria bacterium]